MLLALILSISTTAFAQSNHCVDPDGKIAVSVCQSIQNLLTEHQTATGEDVWVEVVDSEQAKAAFEARNADSPRQRNLKILLAVEPGLYRGQLYVGITLDHKINGENVIDLVGRILGPTLREHRPEFAIVRTLVELLERLESPLVDAPEVQELLSMAETIPPRGFRPGWLDIFLGVLCVGGIGGYYLWTLRKRRRLATDPFSEPMSMSGDRGPTGASSAEWSPQDDLLASGTSVTPSDPKADGRE